MDKLNTTSRITEVNAVAIRIVELYGKNTVADDEFLKNLIGILKTQSNSMTIAIRHGQVHSELKEKDAVRDKRIRALKALLSGFCKFPDDATRTAAERIKAVFDKYGVSMAKVSYAEETALVESLLKDFAAADVAADIASLAGVAEIVSHLSDAQRDFVSTRVGYEKEMSLESGAEKASGIKREIIDTINVKLITYLAAMQIFDAEKYGAFVSAVSQIIMTNNETVMRRRKKLMC